MQKPRIIVTFSGAKHPALSNTSSAMANNVGRISSPLSLVTGELDCFYLLDSPVPIPDKSLLPIQTAAGRDQQRDFACSWRKRNNAFKRDRTNCVSFTVIITVVTVKERWKIGPSRQNASVCCISMCYYV